MIISRSFQTDGAVMNDIQVLFNTPMKLGECPLWHPDEQVLYWVDIDGFAVHCHNPANGDHRSWDLPAEPGCIARHAGGGLVVAMRTGVFRLDTQDGSLSLLAQAPYDPATTRFNDGRCDAHGRFWMGTIYEPRDHPRASLYCLEKGALLNKGTQVTVSNGLAFSTDNQTLYHADTSAHRITAYQYDLGRGSLGGGRVFRQFSTDKLNNYGGRPDGAAVDSENAYWCAMYEGGRILRLSPEGEILREIVLPVRCPTMVAFGGHDLRTLYITSVRNKRSDDELAAYPASGCVLALQVDVAGRPESAYLP